VRTKGCSFIKNIMPGISLKKILCNFFFFFQALKLVITNRKDQYDIVHAVEESVFVALCIKFLFSIPYVYDMDSSIALQVTEKWRILAPAYPVLAWFERLGVRFSEAVVPVCDSLAVLADKHGSKDTHILRDVSLMDESSELKIDLRKELGVNESDVIILYVGNLEHYQGVDLLAEAFLIASPQIPNARLVIIGGNEKHVAALKERVAPLPHADRINVLGPRPVAALGQYLKQADILASPRTKGNNTPMKIYSYLHAGKGILATRLATHTQVLDDNVALLTAATLEDFQAGLIRLCNDTELRTSLGQAAFKLAEENYTLQIFNQRLNELYQRLENRLLPIGDKSPHYS